MSVEDIFRAGGEVRNDKAEGLITLNWQRRSLHSSPDHDAVHITYGGPEQAGLARWVQAHRFLKYPGVNVYRYQGARTLARIVNTKSIHIVQYNLAMSIPAISLY